MQKKSTKKITDKPVKKTAKKSLTIAVNASFDDLMKVAATSSKKSTK